MCEHWKQAPLPKTLVPLAWCQHWHCSFVLRASLATAASVRLLRKNRVIFNLDQFPGLAPNSPLPSPASTGEGAAGGQGQVALAGVASSTSLVSVDALGMGGCQAVHCPRNVEGPDTSRPTAMPW